MQRVSEAAYYDKDGTEQEILGALQPKGHSDMIDVSSFSEGLIVAV